MNYGEAFTLAKAGALIAREGWVDKHITFKDGSVKFNTKPQLLMTDGNVTRAWVAYPEDTEATDWVTV